MKKISLFLFIFLVLFLSSCESVDNDSKIQEFKAYSAYLEKDIISADQFKDVMNHFTYEIVPAVFDIRSEVRDAKTFDIIETITGSGIAIKIESPYVIILTSASFAHEVGENIISYHITDRNGNERIGTLIRSSEDSGLALIQFYLAPGFIGFPPLRWSIRQVNLNEPVVLLGYQYHIKNAMTMGLVSNVSENYFLKKYTHNSEMLHTILTFLEHNQNINQTAAELYIHRNTLLQRLDKFQSITGFDIKKFQDAFIVYQLL
jgi:hypothetical protein